MHKFGREPARPESRKPLFARQNCLTARLFHSSFLQVTAMGIKNLSKLIGDNAAGGVREQEMASYFGRKVAIDASMTIYQFMVRFVPSSFLFLQM